MSVQWIWSKKLVLVVLSALLILAATSGVVAASQGKPEKPEVYAHQIQEDLVISWAVEGGSEVKKWLVQVNRDGSKVKRRWLKSQRSRLIIENAEPGDYTIRVRGKNNAGLGPVRVIKYHVSGIIMIPLSEEEWQELLDSFK